MDHFLILLEMLESLGGLIMFSLMASVSLGPQGGVAPESAAAPSEQTNLKEYEAK